MSVEYTPTHGDQISGSPATLNRYITLILSQGAHFQFIDGETIEVLVPGSGESVVTTLGDTVVEAKPVEAPAPAVEPTPEPEPDLSPAEDLAAVEEPVVEEAPKPKTTRGRKPKATPAPTPETSEGE